MQRSFEAYWRDPRPLAFALEAGAESPEYREALTYLDPDFEWKTVFLGETHSGYLETAKVWDDYLRWAEETIAAEIGGISRFRRRPSSPTTPAFARASTAERPVPRQAGVSIAGAVRLNERCLPAAKHG